MARRKLALFALIASAASLTTTCTPKRATAIVLFVDTDIAPERFGQVMLTVTGRSAAGPVPMYSRMLTRELLGRTPGSLVLAPQDSSVTEVDILLHYLPTIAGTGSAFDQKASATFARNEWRQLEMLIPDQCTNPNIEVLCRTTRGPNGEEFTCGSDDPSNPCVRVRRETLAPYRADDGGTPDARVRMDASVDVPMDASTDARTDASTDVVDEPVLPATIDPPILLWPPSNARVSGRQPLFKVRLELHSTGAEISFCNDADCRTETPGFRVVGAVGTRTQGMPPAPLVNQGAIWWRARGINGNLVGTRVSRTRMFVMANNPQVIRGSSLGRIPDVNRDGIGDVIVGRPGTTAMEVGAVYRYHTSMGAFGASVSRLNPTNPVMGERFGAAMTVCDFNGDGLMDLAVGSPGSVNFAVTGRVAVYEADGMGNFAATPVQVLTGPRPTPLFGFALSGGDIDGDGRCDLIVGSPRALTGNGVSGEVYLYPGTSTLMNRLPSLAIAGAVDGAEFGASVASGADINADGFEDLVVGAPQYDGTGKALVFLSNQTTTTLVSPEGFLPPPGSIGVRFGHSVALVGDINLDGRADIAIGSPLFNSGAGAVWLELGAPSGMFEMTPTQVVRTAPGQTTALGWTVTGVGNVDARAGDDIAASSPTTDIVSSFDVGELTVFCNPINVLAAQYPLSTQVPNSLWSWATSYLGDINEDGIDDFVSSASYARDAILATNPMGNGFLYPVLGGVGPTIGGNLTRAPDPDPAENGEFGYALPR